MEDRVTLKDIIDFAKGKGLEVAGPASASDIEIKGGKNVQEAGANEITFISQKYAATATALLAETKAPLVVLDQNLFNQAENSHKVLIAAADAKKALLEILEHFFSPEKEHTIHPSAVIDSSAKIGQNVHIGSNAVIEADVEIGDNSFVDALVLIRSKTKIGKNVIIKASSVIGGTGFGFVPDEEGMQQQFPHFGGVIIEDDVQIGSCTCIDRGSLSDTKIRKGVKIDNLVHVAHNVEIGENSLVIACTLIGGSTTIGANSWIAPSATLRNGIKIGDKTTIGMGAVVTKDVPANTTVTGVPAMPLEQFKELMRKQKDWLKEK